MELVARDGEQERAHARRPAKVVFRLRQSEERLLHDVGHVALELAAEEAIDALEVALEEPLPGGGVPLPPGAE